MSNRVLFAATVFLAAFLLFVSEPIAARQLLPIFGGSAAVWITCLVFFQTALLAGYLYAHLITRVRRAKIQPMLHAFVLLFALRSASRWANGSVLPHVGAAHPAFSIFAALTRTIGLPFLLLASTSPLLQTWFVRVQQRPIPYRLFALSNAASLFALFIYPLLIEPRLRLTMQRVCWSVALYIFAVLLALICYRVRKAAGPLPPVAEEPSASASPQPDSATSTRLLWFLLPLAASAQLSAVSAHLTQNIAAIPLLWILPLAVYLLTFVVAFEAPRLYHRGLYGRFLAVLLGGLAYVLSKTDVSIPISLAIGFFLLELFFACTMLHGETARLRPSSPREATLFYLLIASGGAAGAVLLGIIAPLVFAYNYDLVLTFLLTALLILLVVWRDGSAQRLLWATGAILMFVLVLALRQAYATGTMLATRNFYGALRVKSDTTSFGAPMRSLLNGTIQHGTQIFTPELMRTPTTYYAEDSGIGLALANCCEGRPRNIGVVGLGAGTLAAYGRAGDRMRFYEINPAVRPIAEHLFTYLRQSGAAVSFVEGDARASLAAEAPQHFDVLVLDAFSGDAIPLHLLTTQAMGLYLRHLAPGGVLAIHVSNQYVELQPEIAALARASNLEARNVTTPANDSRGEFRASWVLVSRDPAFFEQAEIQPYATRIQIPARVQPWTDDYSSLIPVLRW